MSIFEGGTAAILPLEGAVDVVPLVLGKGLLLDLGPLGGAFVGGGEGDVLDCLDGPEGGGLEDGPRGGERVRMVDFGSRAGDRERDRRRSGRRDGGSSFDLTVSLRCQ